MKERDEVVEALLAVGLPSDRAVDLEPQQFALVVVVGGTPPVVIGAAGRVQNLRGGGGVLQIAPHAPGARVVVLRPHRGEAIAIDGGIPYAGACGEHVAQVLRQALIDPQQIALHRLLIVLRGQPSRATVLAVPRVRELVRQQKAGGDEGIVIDKSTFPYTVVRALMVLQTEVRDLVAERDEEMVVAVVTRLIERACLADQRGELVDVLLREGYIFRAVAG